MERKKNSAIKGIKVTIGVIYNSVTYGNKTVTLFCAMELESDLSFVRSSFNGFSNAPKPITRPHR